MEKKQEIENLERTESWLMLAEKLLCNKVIHRVRWQYWYADSDDREEWGVYSTGLVLDIFDPETEKYSTIYVSQDDEQNGPGALVVQYEKGNGKQKHMEQKTLPVNVDDYDEYSKNLKEAGKNRWQLRAHMDDNK